jgi:hypothetical protein
MHMSLGEAGVSGTVGDRQAAASYPHGSFIPILRILSADKFKMNNKIVVL